MELENKIKGMIFGLFGSIIASSATSLCVSFLTSDYWTILLSGLIVGIASSFANAFGPLVSSSQMLSQQSYAVQDFKQAIGSSILTFIIIGLPLISYILINKLDLARIISITTSLVLLFIFGIHKAQMEHDTSPLRYGFLVSLFGTTIFALCYYLVNL
jgi:VIT1/CCC1 family predicted Fe2+/Mn2+ transporter